MESHRAWTTIKLCWFFAIFNVERVFPGIAQQPEWIGNTVLLELARDAEKNEPQRYVFIGDGIYEFTAPDNDSIVVYYSMVGNSDVPYPVAVGNKYAYFMLDRAYVPREDFGPDYDDWLDGAYSEFFDRYTTNDGSLTGGAEPFPAIQNIMHRIW